MTNSPESDARAALPEETTNSTAEPTVVRPASGPLGVLTPGMGAVSSTFIAGVMSARSGHKPPVGSLSQTGRLDDGSLIRDAVPLASLDDLVFGGWDPISPNALEAARTAGVLSESDLNHVSRE